jgi:hypothetical protein
MFCPTRNVAQMSVSTTHNFSYQWDGGAQRQRAESAVYPMDIYKAFTTFEAFDAVSNTSIPVAAVHTVGGVSGFVFTSVGNSVSTTRSTDGLFVVFDVKVCVLISFLPYSITACFQA